MLTLTRKAARAIRALTDSPAADGVRIYAGRRFARSSVQIEVASGPDVEDTVLEAEGARLFVEPETMEELDHKVLDADDAGAEPRFAVYEQAD